MGRIDKKRGILLGIAALIIIAFVIVNMQGSNELTLWYTDDNITSFVKNIAKEYETARGIKVEYKLIKDAAYYEILYKEGKKGPDLFIGKNSDLEKIDTYGLAKNIDKKSSVLNNDNYPQAAIEAVKYNDKLMGFPLSFETSILYYNDKYITDLPQSIDALKDFSSADVIDYDGDNIIEFDPHDIMGTYPFAGSRLSYLDEGLGCDYGDEKFIEALEYYQGLNQKFIIDTDKTSKTKVLRDFIDEDTVYILGSTNYISKLNKAGEDFSYKIAEIPNINNDIEAVPLSVTSALFINKNSKNSKNAIEFAEFMSFEKRSEIFSSLETMPAAYLDKTDENIMVVYKQYDNSDIISKSIKNSEMLSELEIILRRVWSGEDIKDVIKEYE